jgi:hypothetical protein
MTIIARDQWTHRGNRCSEIEWEKTNAESIGGTPSVQGRRDITRLKHNAFGPSIFVSFGNDDGVATLERKLKKKEILARVSISI